MVRNRLAATLTDGTQIKSQIFVAGDAVNRAQLAFVSRDAVVGEVEQQVFLAAGCPGLILYARRRMGKSTILRNFVGFLPSSVTVATVSMQHPDAFRSQEDLCGTLARTVGGAGTADSVRTLSDLMKFLTQCDRRLAAENGRVILALDEYEALDNKIGAGVLTTDFLATVRESIQTHRQITWLFAGSHAIAELRHAEWSSYLISARTIEVPPFALRETRQLLTDPLKHSELWRGKPDDRPRFPEEFWGEAGIERIHTDAAGWPHLVQLLAETAVGLVNQKGAAIVSAELYQRTLAKAIISGHNVLYELLIVESRLPGEAEYIARFRQVDSQPPPDDEAVGRSLKRRQLITATNGEWRFRVPLMQLWLRERE